MNIALIDDEIAILEDVRKCVENEILPQDEVNFFVYTRAKDFIQAIEQGDQFDILVSDIDMPDMGGLELGKRLHEKGGGPYLVFLTAYLEYAAESYIIEAYQYILKEDMEKRLPPILRQLIDRVKKEKQQFRMIGTPTSKVQVYYRKKLSEKLGSDEFILIERGYIINVSHIASMKDGMVHMDNGAKIFVNRISFKKIKEQISLYRGNL